MTPTNLLTLQSSAARGDVEAQVALGKHLIATATSAQDAQAGQAHLKAALNAGSGEAAAFIAVMIASGMTGAPNWDAALDYLALAASRDHVSAQEQLRLFADAPASDAPDAKGWRANIDLQSLLSLPDRQSLCDAPRIRKFTGFLPPRFCEWIIASAAPKRARALVYDTTAPDGRESDERTNSETSYGLLDLDLIILLAQTKIAAATQVPLFAMEKSKVLHYEVGQVFQPHYDYLDPAHPAQRADIQRSGQRLATCLIYLNTEFEGGETAFPTLGQKYKCKTGGALLFANIDEAGQPDPRTLHAGLAPETGEKWLFSQWIRSGPQPG